MSHKEKDYIYSQPIFFGEEGKYQSYYTPYSEHLQRTSEHNAKQEKSTRNAQRALEYKRQRKEARSARRIALRGLPK